MRRVDFSPGQLPAGQEEFWAQWESDAADATEKMLSSDHAGEPFSPDKSAIWRRLKEWYLEHVFAGKCAYCEGKYQSGFPQHAEHWRPKEKVTRIDGDRETVVEESGSPHPGYWWLAYSWENLVPACFYCNTGNGKGTKFPIGGAYVFSPGDCVDIHEMNLKEKPWLLHPFGEPHPEDHIGFYKDGTAYAKDGSEYGHWTITVMDLNRETLVIERRIRQEEAIPALVTATSDSIRHGIDVNEEMSRWDGPAALFSRAVEDYLLPIRGRVAAQMQPEPTRQGP